MIVRYIATLLLGIFFGAAGILLDLDHIAPVIQKGLPLTLYNLSHHGSRAAHLPVFAISGIVLCVALTYLVGWIALERSQHE